MFGMMESHLDSKTRQSLYKKRRISSMSFSVLFRKRRMLFRNIMAMYLSGVFDLRKDCGRPKKGHLYLVTFSYRRLETVICMLIRLKLWRKLLIRTTRPHSFFRKAIDEHMFLEPLG